MAAATDPTSSEFNLLALKWRDLGFQYVFNDRFGFDEHEIAEFAVHFRTADTLGDGLVPSDEIAVVLQRCGVLGENFNWFEMMAHLDIVDPYARGVLDFQQFLQLQSFFKMPMVTESEIVEAFRVFDRDDSGAIDAHELMHVMQTIGDTMTEAEAEKMILQCDADGSGEVEYWEFAKMVLSEF
jgi:Ca2+-binding EF-hand superfamily protein